MSLPNCVNLSILNGVLMFTDTLTSPLANLHTSPATVNPSDAVTYLHPMETLQLSLDWTYPELVSNYTNISLKITNVWVGTFEAPASHWDQLVDTGWQTMVTLGQDKNIMDLVFILKKRDGFTFNIQVAFGSPVSEYCISSTLPHNLPSHPNNLHNQQSKYIEPFVIQKLMIQHPKFLKIKPQSNGVYSIYSTPLIFK